MPRHGLQLLPVAQEAHNGINKNNIIRIPDTVFNRSIANIDFKNLKFPERRHRMELDAGIADTQVLSIP